MSMRSSQNVRVVGGSITVKHIFVECKHLENITLRHSIIKHLPTILGEDCRINNILNFQKELNISHRIKFK